MPDIKKVIKGLQDAEISLRGFANHFPPLREECHEQADACHDAISLLKEQQDGIEPVDDGTGSLICGNQDFCCGTVGSRKSDGIEKFCYYCPNCGMKVKWNA